MLAIHYLYVVVHLLCCITYVKVILFNIAVISSMVTLMYSKRAVYEPNFYHI